MSGTEGTARPDYFSGQIAAKYDANSADMADPVVIGATVDFLAELAGTGRALELAIGTGRIGVPLSERGVPVSGIDLSPDMVEQLRAKPGADAIDVAVGDMTSTTVDGTFRVVYLVYNTIQNVTTQDAQVEIFCNAAAHLEPGGCFVIEVAVPQLRRLPPGDTAQVFTNTATHIGFDELDVAEQLGVSHHIWLGEGGPGKHSMPWRWAWPAEYDLMARLAGLRLRERWAGWGREPFTSDSWMHVSVWEKPGE